jgi:hypothetical protein
VYWCSRIPTFRRILLPTSSFQPENGCSEVLRKLGILPHHYTMPQPQEGGGMIRRNVGYPTTSLHGVTTWRWRQQGPPKRRYPTTSLHGAAPWRWKQHGPPKRSITPLHVVTTHKTTAWIFIAVKASNLTSLDRWRINLGDHWKRLRREFWGSFTRNSSYHSAEGSYSKLEESTHIFGICCVLHLSWCSFIAGSNLSLQS